MAAPFRTFSSAIALSLSALTLAVDSPCALAQAPPATEETYVAIVTADDVYVRSGPADSYYPFGRMNTGAFVKVTGEKYSWARVLTIGPAFKTMFGYVKYEKSDTSKLRIDSDGKTAVTLGRIDIMAPNMDADFKPGDSWKAMVKLDVDQKLTILETIEAEKDVIQKVALPGNAQGWIAMAYLKKATPDESKQWLASIAGGTTPALAEVPAAENKPKPVIAANAPSNVKPISNNTTMRAPPQPEVTITDVTLKETTTDETINPDGSVTTETETVTATDTTETVTPEPAPPREPTIDDLEGAFKLLQKEPIETAEVLPLRELYLALGRKNPGDARVVKLVAARADQLQVWADLQKKRLELEDVRARIKSSADETDAAWRKLEASAEYTAVGRVAASTIYDGKGLPKLLRLQDGGTGRTLAYLKPDEKFELVNLIGNLVGIVGDKSYDETLRLNIISPRRIDILTPTE